MASSTSPASQRRRPHRKRQPLSRSNSSFLGTIKNLVTAPLAWFAGADEFEDSTDSTGKRRRLSGAPTEPTVEEDDRVTRTKRMRVDSPPPDVSLVQVPSSAAQHGYLDPPGSVFQQQQRRQPSPFNQPISTRSASVTQPYDFSSNTSNLIRASTLTRTMSIDPPPRPLSRVSATPSVSVNRDTSMDSSSFVRSVPRDMSMPPLSTRPSFRMRTSMTPQPLPTREVSEPPPLHSLIANPTFVRAPPVKTSESRQDGLSSQSSVTLGSLVDSVRATRSPVRQHSSILFGTSEARTSRSPHPESAIEKALHELDIYKTPLVPTRLRSSNIPVTSSSTDLFKSRRFSQLVLMKDDKRADRLGRKVGGKKELPVVNETKPYAGEGGMKKLLARRKQEVGEENAERRVAMQEDDEDRMDHDDQKAQEKVPTYPVPADVVPPPLPTTAKSDWLPKDVSASSRSVATSSLRVGRTKTRNHIARPARLAKTKFSAAYDEDDAMEDAEELDADAVERKKEREVLDEAAKRAPVFQIPEGFTFAKEIQEVKDNYTTAKEPPIKSLPFSFAKASQESSTTSSSAVQTAATSAFGGTLQPVANPAPVPSLVPPVAQTAPVKPPLAEPAKVAAAVDETAARATAETPASVPVTSTGVPNFFANSTILAKPLELPEAAPLTFGTSTDVSKTTSSNLTPAAPVKDAENPLWEGESKKESGTQASSSTLFGAFGGIASGTAQQSSSAQSSLFSTSKSPALPAAPASTAFTFGGAAKKDEAAPTPSQPPSFGAPSTTPTFAFPKPAEPASTLFGGNLPKAPSPFGDASASTTPVPSFSASKSFGESTNATEAATASTFGASTPAPTGLFPEAPKTSTPAPTSFSFAQPSAPSEALKPSFGAATPAVEAAKPLFGGGAFSFGTASVTSQAEQKAPSTPFAFGAAPSTPPPAETKKSAPFTFGAPVPTAPAPTPQPIGFSFSGGGSAASDVSSKPFTFGQPAVIAPAARPSTPPKTQEQEVSMDESPTRDTQQTNKPADRPSLGGAGFSFPSSTSASTFGGQSTGTSTAFSFGTQSVANPFAKDNKPAANTPFAGGFGQGTPSTPFTFGQTKPAESEPARPSTAGSFAFGAPSSAATPAPAFQFGAQTNTTTGGAFGQPQSGSAPGSPSTFSQSSPFAFGAPLPAVNTSFSFASQPASPAGGGNVSLPQPTTPGGFGSTGGAGFGQPPPSSPFGAPPSTAPPPAGGALFTIGSAPAPSPAAGARQIRKLPTRRAGAKR
ncbi:hypothetical protein LshimejAT787_0207370 [Lyophyllum shimeji]|uniref:Uncharacterized protein n=1 Tax=Lyophyllum shimeji TaxID=47721 RepID=A0A9P3UJ75_LYOSH|nr:hypothetical protein LshimejAT787_0207370 [Lyophyllum shimeji]